ncbi:MAG: cell division protein FtsA [Candidatus Marinimicrobia bacterium]|nr:cell division protein FtsA [Candidatus Neomarinimicrobiota bacterium]
MKSLNRIQDKTINVGIDIGTSRIRCAIAEVNTDSKEIKLLGIGSSPSSGIKQGSIIHRDQIIDEIETAITDAETMAGMKVNHVHLSISGDHIRGINTQGAIAIQKNGHSQMSSEYDISREDVRQVLELAKAISFPVDRDILHILPQEYVIDTMTGIKDPVGMSGRRLEARVHLVTMATSTATNLAGCIEELGLTVEGFVFQGLASTIATVDEDEKELGVAVVNIGAGTTDITVFHDGGVRHTGVIPIGASSITNDIAVMLQIGKEDAEMIKLKYASAKSSMASPELNFDIPVKEGELKRDISEHEVSRYVEARMVELLQLIAREISRADIHESLTYGLVLTGGGAQLKNLTGLAEETLKLRTRIGIPKGVSGAIDIASTAAHSGVVGLVRWPLYYDEKQFSEPTGLTFKTVVNKLSQWFKEFF